MRACTWRQPEQIRDEGQGRDKPETGIIHAFMNLCDVFEHTLRHLINAWLHRYRCVTLRQLRCNITMYNTCQYTENRRYGRITANTSKQHKKKTFLDLPWTCVAQRDQARQRCKAERAARIWQATELPVTVGRSTRLFQPCFRPRSWEFRYDYVQNKYCIHIFMGIIRTFMFVYWHV